MIEIQAPHPCDQIHSMEFQVFLAGSIENGKAVHWQKKFIDSVWEVQGIVLNPRRAQWNSEASKEELRTQIEWELGAINQAHSTIFYFDPCTKSPITLLELGLHASTGKHCIVCCPEGYWRKTNVDVVCERYKILQVETLKDLCANISEISEKHYKFYT